MSRVFALMLRSVAAQALRRVSKHEGAPWVGSGPTSPSRRAHAEACALLRMRSERKPSPSVANAMIDETP